MRSKLNTGGRKDLIKSRPVLKFFLRKLTQKKRLRSVKSETHQQLSCKASRESTTLTGSSFSNLRKGRRPMNQLKKLKGCKQKYDKYAYRFRRILNTKSIDPSAVYNAKKILGTSSDYGASILPKFFETQPSYPHFMQNLERFGALNFLPASTFL